MSKTNTKHSKKVRGVWTGSGEDGDFLPFPLPFHMGPFLDEGGNPEIKEMLLHYGDPHEWSSSPPPLVVEVRAEFHLSRDLGKHLLERAKQLRVDITELPELGVVAEPTREEEKYVHKSCRVAAGMVLLALFRWLGWREGKAPNGLRVPTTVDVGKPVFTDSDDNRASVEYALLNMREEALRCLQGTDREQFAAYCAYWDQQHGKSNADEGAGA